MVEYCLAEVCTHKVLLPAEFDLDTAQLLGDGIRIRNHK